MKNIKTLQQLKYWSKEPVKFILIILILSIGTGIFILTFNIKTGIQGDMIVHISSEEDMESKRFFQKKPPLWNQDIIKNLLINSSYISDVSIITQLPINNLNINGSSYKIENIIGSDPSYIDIYSLEIIEGSRMSDQDYNSGIFKVWLSEEIANFIFGTSEDAIGSKINNLTVAGIYKIPSKISKKAYGIADVIFPATAALSEINNDPNNIGFTSINIAAKSNITSLETISLEINRLVQEKFDNVLELDIWEGDYKGDEKYIYKLRENVKLIKNNILFLRLAILLLTSFSMFILIRAETNIKKKNIAIERALGASKIRILTDYFKKSIIYSSIGSILGLILTLIISNSILKAIKSLLVQVSEIIIINYSIEPISIFYSIFFIIISGGILGVSSLIPILKGSISDSL